MDENKIYDETFEETAVAEFEDCDNTVDIEYRKPGGYKKAIIGGAAILAVLGIVAYKSKDKIKKLRTDRAKKYLKKMGYTVNDKGPAELTGDEIDVEYVDVTEGE